MIRFEEYSLSVLRCSSYLHYERFSVPSVSPWLIHNHIPRNSSAASRISAVSGGVPVQDCSANAVCST